MESKSIPVLFFDFTMHECDKYYTDISSSKWRRPERESLFHMWHLARDGVGFQRLLNLHRVCNLWLTSKINSMFTECQALLDCGMYMMESRVRVIRLWGSCLMNHSYNICPLAMNDVHLYAVIFLYPCK